MRVLYFGDPLGAVNLFQAGINIVGLVHGRRGGPSWKALFQHLRRCQTPMPRWMRPDLSNELILRDLSATKPDLIVSCFYPELIPLPILALAPGINVHPSDLPQWRGPDPIVHTLLSGQRDSAVCVHALTEALDAGDIYLRKPVQIDPRDDAGRLSIRLEELGASLITEVVVQWQTEGQLQGTPQGQYITWAPQLGDDWWEIDWHRSAVEVDRFIRAAYPHPGAYTGIGNELLVIQKAHATSAGRFDVLPAGTPFIRDNAVCIRCGEGAMAIQRLKLGRRQLTGISFAQLLQ